MNVLEKILEEIEKEQNSYEADHAWNYSKGMEYAKEIICSHMNEVDNDGWISVEEGLPVEHDSMFANFKGTKNWHNGMFEKRSDKVNVTVEFEDGTRKTATSYTLDGKWKAEINQVVKRKVIAWQPLPEPYKPKKTVPVAGMDHIMSRFTRVE